MALLNTDRPERGWPTPAEPAGQVRLRIGDVGGEAVSNVSAALRIDDSLFLSADEGAHLLRLTRSGRRWVGDATFALGALLDLADADAEADLEGLAFDDGWLWLIGSHARTRRKVEKAEDACIDLAELADLKDTRARCLVARLPLVADGGGWRPVKRDGDRRAGLLKQTKHGNALMKALKADPLIGPFTRVPAKEGGLDIEGVAVIGDRIAFGLRGPIVGGHAALVEARIEARPSGRLSLAGAPVIRLLALEGLGIRDLKRMGDDLLILAGPTTGLSGPCAIHRWRGWAGDPPRDPRRVRLHRPERLLDLPFGRGEDHPEGLALWDDARTGAHQLLVVCDSPSPARLDPKRGVLRADYFRLPG